MISSERNTQLYQPGVTIPNRGPTKPQPAGTRTSESIQSLLRNVPFFSDLMATDVSVTKSKVLDANGDYTTTWSITFIDPLPSLNQMTYQGIYDPSEMTDHFTANLTRVTPVNVVGGSFILSFDGQSTESLPFDATAMVVQNALLNLTSVYDSVTDIGDVVVSRRGPGINGQYR
jgi:hypothetical protein